MMYIILFFHILSELPYFVFIVLPHAKQMKYTLCVHWNFLKCDFYNWQTWKCNWIIVGRKKHKSKTLTLRSCKVTNYFPLILQFNRGAARCCGLFMLYLILQTVICTSDFVATPERTANNNNYSPQHVYYSQICKEMWWRLGVWRAKNEHN